MPITEMIMNWAMILLGISGGEVMLAIC